MSITLSIPPDVVQEVRTYAHEKGTTMTRLIRDYFINLVTVPPEKDDVGSCKFIDLAKSADVKLPEGWRFDRNECYERNSAR